MRRAQASARISFALSWGAPVTRSTVGSAFASLAAGERDHGALAYPPTGDDGLHPLPTAHSRDSETEVPHAQVSACPLG